MTTPTGITPITQAEFEAVRSHALSSLVNPESAALLALAVDTGFKCPCHWEHKNWRCRGIAAVDAMARQRRGMSIAAYCTDGTLYVLRVA